MSGPTTERVATQWRSIALAIGAGVAGAIQVGKLAPLLPQLRVELGLDLVMGGWLSAIINAVVSVGGLTIGLMADRVGRRRALIAGLLIMALGNLAGALAVDGMQAIAARLIEGLGFLLCAAAAPAVIVEAASLRDQRQALAWWSTYMPVGVALAMALCPIAAGILGWRGVWIAMAALLACFAAIVVFWLPATLGQPHPSGMQFISAWRGAAGRPGVWLLAGCFAFYSLQWFAVVTWLPTIIQESAGIDPGETGRYVALVVLVNIVGSLGGGRLLQRGMSRSTALAIVAIAFAILAPLILTESIAAPVRLILACLFSAIGGMVPGAVLSGVPRHAAAPALIGATNGLVVQISNLGSLLGPPVMAAVVSWGGGWSAGRGVLVTAAAGGLILALLLRRIERGLV